MPWRKAEVLFYTVKKTRDPTGNKILDLSKLKAFADDKSNVTQNLKFIFAQVQNILGQGENAGYQHFLLFLQCFLKLPSSGSLKVGIVW